MGHERLGLLPKTRKWRDIVEQIAAWSKEPGDISLIIKNTLSNINYKFKSIYKEKAVVDSFKFLVLFSLANKSEKPKEKLASYGFETEKLTIVDLAKALVSKKLPEGASLEYASIAQKSVIEAISIWFNKNKEKTLSLFEEFNKESEVWRKTGTGAGFCEISRLFFSKFTEHYLNYFLEREASAVSSDIATRDEFAKKIEEEIEKISLYAFETSKITQSFAAGWFNKNIKNELPNEKIIEDFLALAFNKINEELLMDEVSS